MDPKHWQRYLQSIIVVCRTKATPTFLQNLNISVGKIWAFLEAPVLGYTDKKLTTLRGLLVKRCILMPPPPALSWTPLLDLYLLYSTPLLRLLGFLMKKMDLLVRDQMVSFTLHQSPPDIKTEKNIKT